MPPGIVGFHNLITPDNAFDALKFNVQVAYTEAAVDRLGVLIQTKIIDANWEAFLKAADAAGVKRDWQKPNGVQWVEEHLRPANERAKVQLPTLQWANEADYKDKDGASQRKTMKAWDAGNNLIAMSDLHMGMGTTAQAVVVGGLFVSALIKQPQPSFKLQGIRIINLVQYGAGGAALGEISEEDMAILGGDVEVSDLGSFAAGHQSRPAAAAPAVADVDLPF
jgi:hypothetical protein